MKKLMLFLAIVLAVGMLHACNNNGKDPNDNNYVDQHLGDPAKDTVKVDSVK